MLRAKAMGDYLRFRNVLPKRVTEMRILEARLEWTQQYEWPTHYPIALKEAWPSRPSTPSPRGRRPESDEEDEAVAYDFSIELHKRRSVSDAS